jgi:serine/threonine protein kinase
MKNKRGEVQYPAKYWDKISPEAKDLVGRMLLKDPRQRITATDCLKHPWFNEENINRDNYLDVTENIKNLNDEMVVDYKQMKNEDVNMLTCTPVLAGRKLDFAPESPFLTANNHLKD